MMLIIEHLLFYAFITARCRVMLCINVIHSHSSIGYMVEFP